MQNYPRKLYHTIWWNENIRSKLSLVYLGTRYDMMSSNKKRMNKQDDVHSLTAVTNSMYFSFKKSTALTGFVSFLHIG